MPEFAGVLWGDGCSDNAGLIGISRVKQPRDAAGNPAGVGSGSLLASGLPHPALAATGSKASSRLRMNLRITLAPGIVHHD